jgi:hypothetical protein
MLLREAYFFQIIVVCSDQATNKQNKNKKIKKGSDFNLSRILFAW